jgi:hypothetical protein
MDGLARSPLSHALGACLFAATVSLVAPAAAAQSVPPLVISQTGTTGATGTGPAGSGGTGGQAADADTVGQGYTYPSIYLSTVGGTGGTGSGEYKDSNTGPGGQGGDAGQVNLTLNDGAVVSSNVATADNPNAAVWLRSVGGTGGAPGEMSGTFGYPGMPGAGGNGNSVTFNQQWNVSSLAGWNGSQAGTTAVLEQSIGGDAGQPLLNDGADGAGKVQGANGNTGGNGGVVGYNLSLGNVSSQGSAVVVQSEGGAGSNGTGSYSTIGIGIGGDGGKGGDGGAVNVVLGPSTTQDPLFVPTSTAVGAPPAATGSVVVVDKNGNTAEAADMAAGVLAQSIGGLGGAGGNGDGTTSTAGSGGAAGSAGDVSVIGQNFNLSTTGFAAAGIIAQSVGGAGGNGSGAAGIFYKKAGNGGAGGNAGNVDVELGYAGNTTWPSNLITTTGADSIGVIAQSIGGGGGVGGAVSAGSLLAGVAIGGNGEDGGEAGAVTLLNGVQASGTNPTEAGFIISTKGKNSSGLVAQSIGGGGGTGGEAQNTNLGAFNYTVGGNGGSGGSAGTPGIAQVSVDNIGIVNTVGGHAKGIVAQAIGGGGGDGGAAIAKSASEVLNIQVAVGGSGGKGGSSGDVLSANDGQILTNGSDAYGMLAQSISGGGGNGGSSESDAMQLPGLSDVPQVTINTSVGGNGGDGSASGNVTATNNGVIVTAGATSHGIMAQSIAGGGGNGGDASALTGGYQTGPTVTVTTSVGGNGGGAAQAGNVTAYNASQALVWTLGDGADGIYAQSVGGGGGSGAAAKQTTEMLGKSSGSVSSLTTTLGGTGGNGSNGGTVTATNDGNVMTIGDNSNGIFAQSVGGGGGRSFGGTESGSGGNVKEKITVAGTSSVAGNGGTVNATNNGNIVTHGGDSAGILAQSVGGGGGKAGSGSTAGTSATGITLSAYLAASTALTGRLGTYGGVTSFSPGGWVTPAISEMEVWASDYLGYAAQHGDTYTDANNGVTSSTLNVGGGTDGDQNVTTYGNGGTVTAANAGAIQTYGPESSGMVAQSVGGGGGQAGTTAANQLQASGGKTSSVTVNLGSHTDNAGDGGNVTVSNSGTIGTQGDASFGMFAQSVGGGGGETVSTSSQYATTSGKPVQINLATGVFALGTGGAITANNSGSIATMGNDAVGIVAQSIGGSGGTAIVMQTGANANGQAISVTNAQADATGTQSSVTVGSNELPEENQWFACGPVKTNIGYNTCGNGSSVGVTTTGGSTVSTAGRDAYGVLAQSIGGGGGWIVGLTAANGSDPFNKPQMAGNGGDLDLTLGGNISTTGAGAYGVLAQSVGGGGILGGDLANAGNAQRIPGSLYNNDNVTRAGNGGNITLNNTGSISTTGAYAHAIFAQSIGGGGGTWATANADTSQVGNLVMGTVGGVGNSGAIAITNSGAVSATGTGSSAVYVDAEGENGLTDVTINNEAGAQITGNASAPAIALMGAAANGNGTVNNAGTITNSQGSAVSAQSFAAVNNQAGGTIMGGMQIGATSGSLMNDGYWGTNASSVIGTATNNGTLDINGALGGSTTATSTLTGNLVNNGTVQAHVDFYGKTGSYLSVQNNVTFGANSSVLVTPTTLMPGVPVAIMGAGNYLGSQPTVKDAGGNYLFNYTASWSGQDMLVQANAASHFAATAGTVTTNQNLMSAAGYLDLTWNANATQAMAQNFARYASVSNGAQYVNALQSLGNEGSSAASVNHVVTSNAFVERMNSCPRFDGDMTQHEHDCAWGRAISNSTDRDAASDSQGYHQSGQVFQMGGQKEVADDWFVGGSVSSDHSSLSATDTQGSVGGEGWTAGLIAKHQMGDWIVSAAVEGGEMTYHSTRYAQLYDLGGTARGKFDVTHWGLHSRISRQFAFDSWYLKPYMDVHATRINADGYTEQGGGAFDLKVAGSHANVVAASPMLEAGTKFDFGKDSTLQVYAGVGGAFYNQDNLSANMQLADQPGPVYFNQSSTLPKERFKTTAGMDLKSGDHWDFRLEYSGESASHLESDTGSLKVSYKF